MSTRKYELLVVLPGTLNDNEAAAKIDTVLEVVKEAATGAPELNTLGKNRLAYPVKQIRYGYFYTIVFSADAEKVKVLAEKMRLSRDVLRAMVSHYNTTLTAQQRQALGVEGFQVAPKAEVVMDTAAAVEKLMKDDSEKPVVESKVERKIETSNLEEINKKLDDLMSGDVIPSV